jgi:hypothetical protein
MRSQNLSPRNMLQDDFWDMESVNMAIALGTHHWSQDYSANSVVHPVTGKEMEYTALMKDPNLQPLWKRGFGNEVGCLFQGIRDIPGTDTCLFVELTNIPKDIKITYGKIVFDYKPHKKRKRTFQARGEGQQVGLLRRCRNFHCGDHNIQNPHQQHSLHRKYGHDDY